MALLLTDEASSLCYTERQSQRYKVCIQTSRSLTFESGSDEQRYEQCFENDESNTEVHQSGTSTFVQEA